MFTARGRRRSPAPATLVVAAVICLGPRVTLLAQQPAPALDVGTRVRLTVPCQSGSPSTTAAGQATCRFAGSLARVSAGTITLTAHDSVTHHDLSAVQRLEISRGRRSYWLVGAGTGFLVGAGATYVVLHTGGSTALCDRSANQDALASGECLGLTALGGLVGAGLGALVGGLIRTERWEDSPLERLRLTVRPRPGHGAALAVTLVF